MPAPGSGRGCDGEQTLAGADLLVEIAGLGGDRQRLGVVGPGGVPVTGRDQRVGKLVVDTGFPVAMAGGTEDLQRWRREAIAAVGEPNCLPHLGN